MLTKFNFVSKIEYLKSIENGLILEPLLKKYIDNNMEILSNNTLLFTNGYVIIDNISKKYKNALIPIIYKYNNCNIYKSINSFDQNNIIIAKQLRDYIINKIINNNLNLEKEKKDKNNILVGFGGEYYLYFCLLFNYNLYDKYIGFTNNYYINKDANYNYNKLNISQDLMKSYLLENYSDLLLFDYSNNNNNIHTILINNNLDIIINLSKINIYILEYLTKIKSYIRSLFIISCKKEDYEKKKHLLPNFININITTKLFIDYNMNQTIYLYYYKKC
jgi:hypothetical protein